MVAATAGREAASANFWIAAAILVLNALQFFLLPILLLPLNPWFGWLLVVVALSTTTMWALIHEGVHGRLAPHPAWNEGVSRALCIAFGAPFQLLRFGHLMHHRFNRSEINRIEVRTEPSSARERIQYYTTLFGGLYLGEMIASALAILPRPFYERAVRLGFGETASDGRSMWPAAQRQLLAAPGRTRMRVDGFLVLTLFASAFWLYGAHWWMLAAALAGRALLLSFLDNAYHYSNALDDPAAGFNLSLPAPVSRLILNYNFHEVHHAQPSLAWSELPREFERGGHAYEGPLIRVALRQLNGPLAVEDFVEPDADLDCPTGDAPQADDGRRPAGRPPKPLA